MLAGGVIDQPTVINGRLGWTRGSIQGDASTTVASGAVLRFTSTGSCGAGLGSLLVNQGKVEFATTATLCMYDGSAITNNGTWELFDGGGTGAYPTFRDFGGSPSFTNNGLVHKSGGASVARVDGVAYRNNGETRVSAGELDIDSTVLQVDAGSYVTETGATLRLTGPRRLATGSAVSGSGKVALSGDIQVDGVGITAGELELSNLEVGFRGVTAGSGYPVFESAGETSFNGSVVLRADAGWCPNDGDVLVPFRFGSHQGNPSIQVVDAEFTATPTWLADRVRFDISNVDCDLVPPTLSGPLNARAITAEDDLLEGRFDVSASDSGTGVVAIQYQWRPAGAPSWPSDWESSSWNGSSDPSISYAAASPNSSWQLRARAVDRKGNTSESATTTVATPGAPYLLAIGDSVTAGHHRDGALILTECEDAGYSYANRYYERLKAEVPSHWRSGFEYDNFAHSGYTTQKVLGEASDMTDACGISHSSPIEQARAELVGAGSPHRSTWKRAVMTVGVNNTDWTDRLGAIRTAEILNPLNDLWALGLCRNEVADWNGWDETKYSEVQDGVAEILRLLDPYGTRVIIPEYYNPAGTGFLNSECAGPVGDGVDRLNDMVGAGITKHTNAEPQAIVRQQSVPGTFVGSDDIQPWFFGTDEIIQIGCLIRPCPAGSVPGWPHPNRAGAIRIGDALPVGVFGWGT